MEAHIWKIEWDESMSVGIPEIDEEHKHFAFLVNEFNHSILDHRELGEIKRRLQLILDDAVQHFGHEERLFKEWQYPDADEHAIKHAQALTALTGIREKFISYGLEPEWINAGIVIKDLLITHILTEDLKYAEYYRNSRVSGNNGNVGEV